MWKCFGAICNHYRWENFSSLNPFPLQITNQSMIFFSKAHPKAQTHTYACTILLRRHSLTWNQSSSSCSHNRTRSSQVKFSEDWFMIYVAISLIPFITPIPFFPLQSSSFCLSFHFLSPSLSLAGFCVWNFAIMARHILLLNPHIYFCECEFNLFDHHPCLCFDWFFFPPLIPRLSSRI